MSFDSVDHVKWANKRAGQKWFDDDTMAWFSSKIETGLFGGRFFVTSEQDKHGHVWDGKRRYTVRRAEDDGEITDASEFGQFASLARATEAARNFARQES